MSDPFFTKEKCDKCCEPITISRKQCWFTEDVMCHKCSDLQGRYRKAMRDAGMCDYEYEGCGYTPIIRKRSIQNEY